MLGLPERTEFNKRIPKQKFYENIDIPHTLKRVFVDQIRIIYWRNVCRSDPYHLLAQQAGCYHDEHYRRGRSHGNRSVRDSLAGTEA